MVFFVVAVTVQKLGYDLFRSNTFNITGGVNITGDEPSYIMQAQALAHLTVHILPTIKHDLAAGVFPTTYPPHATVSMVEQFGGPHGVVSPFGPGLSTLLVPFVVVLGPATGAVIGMISLNTVGLMWLHQRMSWLVELDGLGRFILAVSIAFPAVVVAANQIYPDLPAGLLIAASLVELVVIESRRQASPLSLVIIAASSAVLPWLQPKNLVPVTILGIGVLGAVGWRCRRPKAATWLLALVVVSVALCLLYNQHYYGHVLGLPEPGPAPSRSGVQYTLGLLFDRDQGLMVQVPLSIIGLAAMIFSFWRRRSVAVAATVLSFASILVLNGTYVSNPYGGVSLAGRFTWTLVGISLPWLALPIARCLELRKPLGLPLIVVLLAWGYQAEPILAGHHVYYNPMAIAHVPWPTWWPGLVHALPQFGRNEVRLGYPAFGLPLELLVAVAVLAGIAYWLRDPPKRRVRPGAPEPSRT